MKLSAAIEQQRKNVERNQDALVKSQNLLAGLVAWMEELGDMEIPTYPAWRDPDAADDEWD